MDLLKLKPLLEAFKRLSFSMFSDFIRSLISCMFYLMLCAFICSLKFDSIGAALEFTPIRC